MYNHNFCCELVLILSKVPSERGREKLHIDTMSKTNGVKIVYRSKFSDVYADAMFEFMTNL